MALVCVFCRACRVFKPDDMKIPPEITIEVFENRPNLIVDEITLVAMYNKNFSSSLFIGHYDRFMNLNVWKENIEERLVFVVEFKQVSFDVVLVLKSHIVIPV